MNYSNPHVSNKIKEAVERLEAGASHHMVEKELDIPRATLQNLGQTQERYPDSPRQQEAR